MRSSFGASVAGALGLLLLPAIGAAQTPAVHLTGLTADEVAALRPLCDAGVALLVRDPDAGSRSRITVLRRVHAPAATLHDLIADPTRYPEFSASTSNVEILSRFQNRLAVRMRTSVGIFDVNTTVNLHLVNPHRIDGELLESQLGPGGFRWDLIPDGDGTLLAYTSWGDPTQGNWFLRQLAGTDPSAIAGMLVSYDVMLTLLVGRRAENLSGAHLPTMPGHAANAPGTITAPAPGAWMPLTHGAVVGVIDLDAQGVMTQSHVATWVAAVPPRLEARLRAVREYPHVWHDIQHAEVLTTSAGVQHVQMRIDSALFNAQGEFDHRVVSGANDLQVTWAGTSGDFANDDRRWDVIPDASGSVVMLSGGSDQTRTGMVMRTLLSRVPWMLPGYSAALKMAWLMPLTRGL